MNFFDIYIISDDLTRTTNQVFRILSSNNSKHVKHLFNKAATLVDMLQLIIGAHCQRDRTV